MSHRLQPNFRLVRTPMSRHLAATAFAAQAPSAASAARPFA